MPNCRLSCKLNGSKCCGSIRRYWPIYGHENRNRWNQNIRFTLVMFSCGTKLSEGRSATIVPRLSLAQTLRTKNTFSKTNNQINVFTDCLENPLRSDWIGRNTTSKLNRWHSSLKSLSCFGIFGNMVYVASMIVNKQLLSFSHRKTKHIYFLILQQWIWNRIYLMKLCW